MLLSIKKTRQFGILFSAILTQAGCSLVGIRGEETPIYEVIHASDNKEIRRYEPYIVAKTEVDGPYRAAQSQAFRRLAGYIFGGNSRQESISMTAPVMQSPDDNGEQIAMTAPVMQSPAGEGWVMAFMMPSQYQLEDLPSPKDERVKLAQVAAHYRAAIRYSWLASEERNEEKAQELRQWLTAFPDFKAAPIASYAGYDPPWTIPFLRRQEMLIDLEKTNPE